MPGPPGSKARNDLGRRSAHVLHYPAAGDSAGQVDGPAAENDDSLLAIWPRVEAEDRLERVPADDDGVDRADELVVAMRLAAVLRQPVEAAVRARDEAVHAGADKHGCLHPASPCPETARRSRNADHVLSMATMPRGRRHSFSAAAQTVFRFMSSPASLEPLRKKTQIAEAGPRRATARGIRASRSARVRTNRNTSWAPAGRTKATPSGRPRDSTMPGTRLMTAIVVPGLT